MMRRYRVEGRVQGVGFRHFAQQHAARLQLSGWVRNTDDGAVEAVAAGGTAQLDEFEAELRQGPRGAFVTSLRHLAVSDEVDSPGPFRIT